MGIGIGTFFIAVGALLTFAVNAHNSHGFNIHSAGIVLMIVGAVGLLVSLVIFGPRRRESSTVEQASPDGTLRTKSTTTNL